MKIGSKIKEAVKKTSDHVRKAAGGDDKAKKSDDIKSLKESLGDKVHDRSELSEELFGKDTDELSKEEKKKLKEIEKMLKGEKKDEKKAEEAPTEAPAGPEAPAEAAAAAPPQQGNSALDSQLSQLSISVLQGGNQGAREQLSVTYQQAGGPGAQGVRPETHQLVGLALNGASGNSGLSLAGLGGHQSFPMSMGMSPQFGGGSNQNFAHAH